MKFGIVTDSTCDLPPEVLARHRIASVPLRVTIEGQTARDWLEIQPIELYQRMLSDQVMPRTSPPSIDDFYDIYEQQLVHYERLFSVHISSKLSETLTRARMAAEDLGATDRIIFVDSLHVNAAIAEMVFSIAQDLENGIEDEQAILNEVRRIRDNAVNLYAPDSLRWLVAGGRLSPLRAAVGNLFNIRPYISVMNGVVTPQGTTQRSRVLPGFVERLESTFGNTPIHLTFTTAGARPKVVQEFQKFCQQSSLTIARGRVQMIGSVIGSHLGPNTVGVCAYPENGDLFDM